MKRMRRKFMQQQKKRAEGGGNWQGDVYDEEKERVNPRVSRFPRGEGRAVGDKKMKPNREQNEQIKKKGYQPMKK